MKYYAYFVITGYSLEAFEDRSLWIRRFMRTHSIKNFKVVEDPEEFQRCVQNRQNVIIKNASKLHEREEYHKICPDNYIKRAILIKEMDYPTEGEGFDEVREP